MWQNLRLETFASLLESIVIFKIAFDSFFFPIYGYRFGFMFAPFIILIRLKTKSSVLFLFLIKLLRFGNGLFKKNTDFVFAIPQKVS